MKLIELQVEEGFLHGLQLRFVPGLNVLIGPRGVGKTSVIELIRFCLGVPAYTKENDRKAHEHAMSVLGSGVVTVEADIGGSRFRFMRSAGDSEPEVHALSKGKPIVLAQNEIEKVGLDARGRLRLIDDFLPELTEFDDRERALLGAVVSMTQDLRTTTEQAARIQDEIVAQTDLEEQLKNALAEQEKALQNFSELQPEREALDLLDQQLAVFQAQETALSQAAERLRVWGLEVDQVIQDAEVLVPPWPAEAGEPNLLAAAEKGVDNLKSRLVASAADIDAVLDQVHNSLTEVQASYKTTGDGGRTLRTRLDEAQAGAGALSHHITALRQQISARSASQATLEEIRKSLERDQASRKVLLDEVDSIRQQRFDARQNLIQRLNAALAPEVRLHITRYGLINTYADAIAAALRGSNLRYKTLAPQLAEKMTPRELAEAVERSDAGYIANAAGIAPERASRVVERLRDGGLDDILRASIEDAVSIELLDGGDYKASGCLSTGQRCTAVLPVLLSHGDRVLVIDQPEDHLDNAYIASTVVRSLRNIKADSQLIVSTHNANIPVLGEAAAVTLLGSDGTRGFIEYSDELTKPEIVSAITRVMEGGEEAFKQRASFYGDHPSQ